MNALILTHVKYHQVLKMQPAKIPLVVLTVNVMMVLTMTGLLVWTSMNAQHLMNNTCTTLDSMNVANSPHAPIPLAHMTVYAILVSKVMATIVAISTSVNLRSITVHSMLDVTILWDHIHVNVILGFLVMAKLVIKVVISTNVPREISVEKVPNALMILVVTHVTVKLNS